VLLTFRRYMLLPSSGSKWVELVSAQIFGPTDPRGMSWGWCSAPGQQRQWTKTYTIYTWMLTLLTLTQMIEAACTSETSVTAEIICDITLLYLVLIWLEVKMDDWCDKPEIKMFSNVTPCSLVARQQTFWRKFCLHLLPPPPRDMQ
jgi:hypothetical protein